MRPQPRGWMRSGCRGTTSTARSTRFRAAWSWASTSSWTTVPSTSPRRAMRASSPRRSSIPGTRRSSRATVSSAPSTGGGSRPRSIRSWNASTRRLLESAAMADRQRTTLSIREREAPTTALVPAEELKTHLPGVEHERHLNDWGRSERIEGLFDRTVADFFYRYWFRAEVEGIENVPSSGGALLVSNHAGALPPDAAMISKAIREEHAHPRPVNITIEHFFKGYPGFSALLPKIGCVPAHPANVHRLLYDEEQLVLVFPEGRKATEKLYKDRYRLRRFGRGGFVEAAMRARAPIVPVCVVGAEEAAPVFAQVGIMQRLTGLIYFPITPTFPHFGVLGMLGYLPAKFRIRFLEPIPFDQEGLFEDKALVQTVAHEVRARIQENLWDMLAKRKSVWFG